VDDGAPRDAAEGGRTDPPASIESLQGQLAAERGLREAADAENERLLAQIEQYAEDLGLLYQERHGHGRGGLAAQNAALRAELEDTAARGQVLGQMYRRSVQQARGLADQLVQYGEDLSRAYRRGQQAGGTGRRAWWRRPFALVLLSGAAGLLIGAGAILSSIEPTPGEATGTPSAAEVTPTVGPSGTSVRVLSSAPPGRDAAGQPVDAAAVAATAAAEALAGGTVVAAAGVTPAEAGRPGGPSPTVTAQAPTAPSATPTRSGPDRPGTPVPPTAAVADLAPTVTALSGTVTALSALATRHAQATPSATATSTPTPTLTPAAVAVEERNGRCRFELVVPPLPPFGRYAIRFTQTRPAEVLVFWSHADGEVRLFAADGTEVPAQPATRGVVTPGLGVGRYRAVLRNGGPVGSGETRAALFYDGDRGCPQAPTGEPQEPDPPAPARAAPLTATPASTQPTAGRSAAATPPADTATPSSTPTPTTRPDTPVPPTATPTPELLARPLVDCWPHRRGPSGYVTLRPRVWLDAQRTVPGSWLVRAALIGPEGPNSTVQSASWTAAPDSPDVDLPLSGYGRYVFRVEAEGADLDENCAWEFDHDRFS
jgi:hypothetical protein